MCTLSRTVMSTWLSPPRAAAGRERPVSNGGLGGLVELGRFGPSSVKDRKREERKRPASLRLVNSDGLLPPRTPLCSASSRTPTSAKSLTSLLSWFTDDGKTEARLVNALQSAFSPQFPNTARLPDERHPRDPATRVKPARPSAPPPFELPGSLLLPSQGFAPPPETPKKLSRRTTGDSDLSSTPSVTTCTTLSSACSCTMGFWKLKSAQESLATPESEGWGLASVQGDKSLSVTSTISKPFNLMSIDELLEALPGCNQVAIDEFWIPEMKKKIAATKAIVQAAELRNLSSYKSLMTMEGVRSRLSTAALSLTYLVGSRSYWQRGQAAPTPL